MAARVLGPIPPTLQELAQAVLEELGVQQTGQPVAAEDFDTIVRRLNPKLEELNERDIGYIDPDNISHAQFLPLVRIMAYEMANAFSVKEAVRLALLKVQGGPDGEAEQAIRDITRVRTPRQTMRVEIFNRDRRLGRGR